MEQNTKKVFSRIGLSLTIALVVIFIGQMLLGMLINNFAPSLNSNGWASYLTLIVFYLIGLPLFYLFTKGLPDGEKKECKKLSIKEIIIYCAIAYAALVVVNYLTLLLMYLVSLAKGAQVENPFQNFVTPANIVGTTLFVGILSPIAEEILFRGIMLNKLRCYGDKIAIITTALMFGLFHENFSQFFYAVALGLIFAYVTLKTGTIKYSIILHMFVNLLGNVIGMALIKTKVGSIIWIIVFALIMIAGIFFFIKNIKKISLSNCDIEIEKGTVFKTTCLNLGMILYFVINFALMIFILLK